MLIWGVSGLPNMRADCRSGFRTGDFAVMFGGGGAKAEKALKGIEGFITALPTRWTLGERNHSGIHLGILANRLDASPQQRVAQASPPEDTTT
jgi:hypothetical protein